MKLLINENPLQVLPSLAVAIGLNEAMLLQQIHFRLQVSSHQYDGRTWVFNTAQGWTREFPFWSEATVRRIISSLKKQKLIITTAKYNKKRYDRTTWFSVDYTALELLEISPSEKATSQVDQSVSKATSQVDQMDLLKLTRPIPKKTLKKEPLPTKKTPAPRASKKPNSTDPAHAWFVRWWCFSYLAMTGANYAMTSKDAGQIKQLLKVLGGDLNELVARACCYLALPAGKRFPSGSPTVGGLQCMINQVTDLTRLQEDQFISAGLLPDFDQPEISLTNFTPWSRNDEQIRRTA